MSALGIEWKRRNRHVPSHAFLLGQPMCLYARPTVIVCEGSEYGRRCTLCEKELRRRGVS